MTGTSVVIWPLDQRMRRATRLRPMVRLNARKIRVPATLAPTSMKFTVSYVAISAMTAIMTHAIVSSRMAVAGSVADSTIVDSKNDVDINSDQLSCELRQLVDGFSPAELDYEVLAFDVVEVA